MILAPPVLGRPPEGASTRLVELPERGVTLSVLEQGAGGRPLLFVHGFCGAREDVADHIGALADAGAHVVAPDLRGHGGSTHLGDESAYELAGFADDLVALLDTLGWAEAAVIAHSMGGMVAQELALAAPERIRRLILTSTSGGAPDGVSPEAADTGADIVRQGGMELLLRLQDASGPRRTGAAAHARRVEEERPGYETYVREKHLAADPAMWAAIAPAIARRADRGPAVAEALRTAGVPVTVLVGEDDDSFRHPAAALAAALSADLVVVPGAGHNVQFEAPAAWRAAVLAALAEPIPQEAK